MSWRSVLALSASVGLLHGCATAPAEDPVTALASAEAHVRTALDTDLALDQPRGPDAEAAVALLEPFDEDAFTGEDRERFLLVKARALALNGELWDAYKLIEDFSDEHAFSTLETDVQNLEFAIGSKLIRSSGGFLFFSSDEEDGRVVLEHFVTRYPKHPKTHDALRLLGEKAYAEHDYLMARERYRVLLVSHANSEWIPVARFRIAMASYHELVGPDYDIGAMGLAHRELSDFLDRKVENPEFEREARDALATVRNWIAQKHLSIADFYRTLGNTRGEMIHLRDAAEGFADTSAGQRAMSRLPALEARLETPAGGT